MNRIALALLALTTSASQAPLGHALTLQYFPTSGNAYLLPATSPSGKILTYVLTSNGQFFVNPARTSVFPPPSNLVFTNSTSEISDVDLTLVGTSAIIPLGKLFPTPAVSLQDLTSKFTNRVYAPSLGGGEFQISLEFANLDTPEPIIPEPTALTLAAAALAALLPRRRARVAQVLRTTSRAATREAPAGASPYLPCAPVPLNQAGATARGL